MRTDKQKYLENLLSSTAHERSIVDDSKPKYVRDAERVVRKWCHSQNAKRSRRIRKIRTQRGHLKEMILFGDPDKALAAVKEFAKKKF
jgi:hypothetical protein